MIDIHVARREKEKRKALPAAAKAAQIRKRHGGKGGGKNQFKGRVVHRFRPKKGGKRR